MDATAVVEELRLLHALTLALDRSENLPSALAIVLKEVCRATGWELGEAWLPSPDGTELVQGPAWHAASDRRLRRFEAGSRKYTFAPGRGLPGRVWSSGKPLWVTDVRADANFPRFRMARRIGLKAGFAIPVKASEETIAIIEFFVFEQRREDRRLIELVSAVASQLGGIIRRKVAEEALKRSRYALEAELRERRRVARELHDGVTQLLSSTLFRLRGLQEDTGALERVGPVRRLLEQAVKEVRRISLNLGPCVLEQLGLGAALRALGHDLQARTGASVAVSCPDLPRSLPYPLAWTLYRILQEGMQNIEKHAAATRVRLTLRWVRPWITATLRDDGRGFISPKPPSLSRDWRPQLGLRNMSERAEAVGGSVVVRSAPGEGTLVMARIPWWSASTEAPRRRVAP